ncbi:hypothetical protein LTR94_023840 [Friedmanniomyces endolithicus]|nr:hypothetical protein LTR94_023840 [Friedmanniomyces endolithicus]
MDVITGKTRPTEGSAFFGQNYDLAKMSTEQIAEAGIGRKFQKPTVFENFSVMENLLLAAPKDKRVKKSFFSKLDPDAQLALDESLAQIRLEEWVHKPAGLLSHGQKQWLEIGMLLMQRPKLILLDEPVAGMTDAETERTAELCLELKKNHTLVVVEHDMSFIDTISEKVTVLAQGAILAEGTLAEDVKEPTMLEVKDVNQFYGGSHILRDVSFQAPVGECSVVLGRNGVGKTTLLKCLMGILPIKSGQILLDGQDISKMSPEQRVRAGLAYVPQGRDIFSTLTVEENILIGMAKFKGAKTRKVPEHLYEIFPVLEEMKHRRGGDLSGGQQQQLAIARALASEPRVLILDEPTEGIQPSIIKDIGRVIRKLANGGDMAVVLVEQFYDFAEELADAYTVMARGQVIAQGAGCEMPAKGIRELVAI